MVLDRLFISIRFWIILNLSGFLLLNTVDTWKWKFMVRSLYSWAIHTPFLLLFASRCSFSQGRKPHQDLLRRALFETLMKFYAGRVFLPKFSNKKVLVLSGFAESSIKYGFEGLEGTKPKAKIVVGSDRSSVRSIIKISCFSFHFSSSSSVGNEKASALHFKKLSENA